MSYLVLDVETVPDAPERRGLEWPDEGTAVVGGYLEESRSRVKPGLHPVFSRVALVGTSWDGAAPDVVGEPGDEPGTLSFLAGLVESARGTLVTYNGYGFDVPVLNLRLVLAGLPPTRWDTNRWHHGGGHYDVMQALSCLGTFPAIRLEVAYRWITGEAPPEHPSVEAAQEAWRRGDPGPLRQRCAADVRMTDALYRRLRPR